MENFLSSFMARIGFPPEAAAEFLALDARLKQVPEADRLVNQWGLDLLEEVPGTKTDALNETAEALGIRREALHMLAYIRAAEPLYARCNATPQEEALYWDAMKDLQYKLMECYDVEGIWGNTTENWPVWFFQRKRHSLGRLQYEWIQTKLSYEGHGVTLQPGDSVLNLHIPSSGPLTLESRLDSYRRAYEFYGFTERDQPMVVQCSSWLLYPDNRLFYPPHSNILDFMKDFNIIGSKSEDRFGDAYRVFGAAHRLPLEQWPQDNSLRRAYVSWLSQGNKTGYGQGILIFDGSSILTRQAKMEGVS